MITLGGYLLFSPAIALTGPRVIIEDLDAELDANLVGVLDAPLVGELDPDVECG